MQQLTVYLPTSVKHVSDEHSFEYLWKLMFQFLLILSNNYSFVLFPHWEPSI